MLHLNLDNAPAVEISRRATKGQTDVYNAD